MWIKDLNVKNKSLFTTFRILGGIFIKDFLKYKKQKHRERLINLTFNLNISAQNI